MTCRPYPLIVAIALSQILIACASPITFSPNVKVEASRDQQVLPEPAAGPAEAYEPDVASKNELVTLVSNKGQFEQRFFRPLLTIDGAAAGSLPNVLPDGADVSYVVLDLKRGTVIAEREAERDHIPASSAKLATAVVALEILGPDHRFRTELRGTGAIEDGVLKGDLILKGGGDPSLDIPDLMPLINDLSRLNVRRIDGRFLIDDSQLPRLTEIEPMQPTEAAYNPGLGALSIAFNRVNLRWQNRKALSVETVPGLDEASFERAATDRLPPGGVQLKRFDGREAVWQLADRGARRSKRSLPVKDPGLNAGRIFADLASLHGIDLPAPTRGTESRGSRLIAVHESRPLKDLVRDMLWYSNNLVAELIGLAAAKAVAPGVTSLEESADIVLSELESQLSDISWESARLDNHSGLSSKSKLTPAQLAAVLRHGWNDGMLATLLPASGWSGTLARRFSSQDQAFRIWAKTGSINYVSTLGGFLLSPAHGPAAFVIMISDEEARTAYDAAPRRTRAREQKARAWQRDAEAAMDLIVERWLEPVVERPAHNVYAQSKEGGVGAN